MHFSVLQAATWATVAGSIASAALMAGGESALPIEPPQFGAWLGDGGRNGHAEPAARHPGRDAAAARRGDAGHSGGER